MTKMFEKIGDTHSLAQKVEKSIEDVIRNKQFLTGEKLPTEKEFCDLFLVSRTVVREALKRLSARGLVEIKKGSGIYVSEMDAKKVVDPLNLFFEMSNTKNLILHTIHARQMMEPSIAGSAAGNRSTYDLRRLEKNLEELTACPIEQIEKEMEIDTQFHYLITESAGNPVVKLLMEPIFNLIPKYKTSIFAKTLEINLQGQKDIMIGFHTQIFTAIKNKDQRQAHDVMKEHILNTEKNYLNSKTNQ